MKKILAFILLGLLALVAGGAGLVLILNTAPETFTSNREFSVTEGETLEAIANRLEDEGLIRSALVMRLTAKLLGTEGQFRKGLYRIPAQTGLFGIHKLLVQGQDQLIRVTLPDGYTLRQVAETLEKDGICSATDFLAVARDPEALKANGITFESAEGFLFPDTYLFPPGYPPRKVLDHLVDEFWTQLRLINPAYQDLSSRELSEKIIIASIVEREYVAPEEAPLMASVFYNRLSIGKALESCATVVYVMTEIEGLQHPSRIFYRDLERQSPYNTYRNRGLTPGPISNPGKIALKAAFFPADTDYLYFVLKNANDKKHQFSRTWSEHERATELYFKR